MAGPHRIDKRGPLAPPIPLEEPLEPVAPPPPKVVRGDISCCACGYNLRGMALDGVCPECGAHVERSLMGGVLRYASGAYVRTLHLGALLVELAVVGMIVSVFVSVVMAVYLARRGPGQGSFESIVSGAFSIVVLGASALALVGWWMLSSPDPGLSRDAPGGKARVVLRAGLLVQAAAALATMVLSFVQTRVPATPGAISTLSATTASVGYATSIAWAVSFLAAMSYIAALATRIPDGDLQARAKWLLGLGAVLMGAVVVGGILVVVGFSGGGAAPLAGLATVAVCLGVPVVLVASLVALVHYVLLVDRLREVLKEERYVAEALSIVSSGVSPM